MLKKTIMAIGAHADDIEIYVGGTLLKYRDAGYDVAYVMSTNNMSGNWKRRQGDGSYLVDQPTWQQLQPQRKREAAAAAEFFGTEAIHLDHPQRHYRDLSGNPVELRYGAIAPACVQPDQPTILTAWESPCCVEQLAAFILQRQPEVVLTHGPVALNLEHTATALLVIRAYRAAVEAGYRGAMLNWLDIDAPGLFGASFLQYDTFIDVSDHWQRKLESIRIHACQIPRPENLQYPTWCTACGCQRAEAFTVADWGDAFEHVSPLFDELTANHRAGSCAPLRETR